MFRLIHLIENRSNELAELLEQRIRSSSRTRSFANVPDSELRQRVREVYSKLGDWLFSKTEADIAEYYTRLGTHRAEQGVVLSEFIWSMVIAKESLRDFLRSESDDRAMELLGECEMLQMLDLFFERAAYFSARGYEQQRQKCAAA